MRDGFVKVAAVTPRVAVANPEENARAIIEGVKKAGGEGAKVIVFPELSITGYTCGDLFWQDELLFGAERALVSIVKETAGVDALCFAGLPLSRGGKTYNVAAAFSKGEILGFVPKTYLPSYNEFYEARHFARGMGDPVMVRLPFGEGMAPMGSRILFSCQEVPELVVAAELCEDLWTPEPPSIRHARNGATLIVNLSASDETTGKAAYRKGLVAGQSARLVCGYVYASAGEGESTQDVVYSGHDIIAENGHVLGETSRFECGMAVSEVDVRRLVADRRRMTTYEMARDGYREVSFSLSVGETRLTRFIDPAPFVPRDEGEKRERCEEILSIQSAGLARRISHTGARQAVIGVSGGLDSTLALLVAARAFDRLGLSRGGILAVTMPGFGTTDRTYGNALQLVSSLGATLREVDIKEAVRVHFRDIGHDEAVRDVTYENCQARERTQILMDLANKGGGLVVGTGDLSELALGWATYNGDHMSMYAVNSSVPKTLVRHLVRYYADSCGDSGLRSVLMDVLDTPVSPELLPPEGGAIAQKTEDIVGPYELHDFFLYQVLRFGFPPKKVYRLARAAFAGEYGDDVILRWLSVFYKRFFSQQFKRSCLPDGPKVGSVAVSPRGDLRMPSDASARAWLSELEEMGA